MILWLIFAVVTALVVAAIITPVMRGTAAEQRSAFDVAVYGDQLSEIEADLERGLISPAEADAARLEVQRRLLRAADQADGEPAVAASGPVTAPQGLPRAVALASAVAVPVIAVALYLGHGSPHLPAQPFAERSGEVQAQREFNELVGKVEARLQSHPEDGMGWEVIAPVYLNAGRYEDAAMAFSNAIRLLGENARRLSGLGEAITLQHNGVVKEPALKAFRRALELDGNLIVPAMRIAIAHEQDGKLVDAIQAWRGIMAKGAADAPWKAMAAERLQAAEAALKAQGGTVPPVQATAPAEREAESARGPNAEDVAAASQMSDADRAAMVEQMVASLAERLKDNAQDLRGWQMLVRSYAMLGRKDDALGALAEARKSFTGNPDALASLSSLARDLGLGS